MTEQSEQPVPVSPHDAEITQAVTNLVGITAMTYCCLIFDWENNKAIRANVEFLLDGKKVRTFLELMNNKKWRQVEL